MTIVKMVTCTAQCMLVVFYLKGSTALPHYE